MSALLQQVGYERRFRPERAKAIREAVGVSQQRLADELEVDRVTIARWESGDRTPRPESLVRYLDLLDRLAAETFA